jgi:prevent-host-death family protein
MVSFGTYAAKTNFTDLLARAEAGEEVIITRHGKPVAKLVPIGASAGRDTSDILAEFRAIRERIAQSAGGGGPSLAELVREGRRY